MATRASRIALAGSNISSTGEVDADLLDNTDSSAFLSLAADGNFFIGTSTDIAPANGTNLYVSDGTISRFGLEKTGTDARKFSINNGGTYFSVYDETADAERFRISSTGNVGIGTNSPGSKLHLKSPLNDMIQLKLQPGSDTVDSEISFLTADGTTTKGYVKYKHALDEIAFRTNGAEWVTINNVGDLRVGTKARIQANGVVRYGNGSTGIGALSYGSNLITMEALSTDTSIRLTPSGTGIAEVFSSQLSIKDDNTGGTVLRLWNTDTGGKNWSMYSSASGNGEGAGHFLWNNGTSVPMIIQGDGNVGIGITDPTEKLHVKSSGNAYKMLKLEAATGAGDAGILLQGAAGNQFSIQQPGNAAGLFFYDRTNGITRLTITSDGKVKPGQFVLPVSTSAPSSPDVGQQYYNSNANAVLTYDGTVWRSSRGTVAASGGTESTHTAGGISYKSHTFTSSGTFLVDGSGNVDIMIIAGGAAGGGHGGSDGSGGGGAGGMVVQTAVSAAPGTYNVVIGAGGGATGGATRGNNGSNSSISISGATTAIGGGGGGSETSGARVGKDGGSGGGAGGYGVKAGGLGTNGQGNNGGPCTAPGDGGGGGKGAAGNSGTTGTGGAGSGNVFRTGSNIDYAGGGGGSGDGRNSRGSGGGAGGSGGGGAGAAASSGGTPSNGSVNTGGGGGGAAGSSFVGSGLVSGSGGSGIVVIRYAL